MDKRDKKIFESLGLRFRGKQSWPVLRSYEPGFVPWLLNANECNFLTQALEQAALVVQRVRDEPGLLKSWARTHRGSRQRKPPNLRWRGGLPLFTNAFPTVLSACTVGALVAAPGQGPNPAEGFLDLCYSSRTTTSWTPSPSRASKSLRVKTTLLPCRLTSTSRPSTVTVPIWYSPYSLCFGLRYTT